MKTIKIVQKEGLSQISSSISRKNILVLLAVICQITSALKQVEVSEYQTQSFNQVNKIVNIYSQLNSNQNVMGSLSKERSVISECDDYEKLVCTKLYQQHKLNCLLPESLSHTKYNKNMTKKSESNRYQEQISQYSQQDYSAVYVVNTLICISIIKCIILMSIILHCVINKINDVFQAENSIHIKKDQVQQIDAGCKKRQEIIKKKIGCYQDCSRHISHRYLMVVVVLLLFSKAQQEQQTYLLSEKYSEEQQAMLIKVSNYQIQALDEIKKITDMYSSINTKDIFSNKSKQNSQKKVSSQCGSFNELKCTNLYDKKAGNCLLPLDLSKTGYFSTKTKRINDVKYSDISPEQTKFILKSSIVEPKIISIRDVISVNKIYGIQGRTYLTSISGGFRPYPAMQRECESQFYDPRKRPMFISSINQYSLIQFKTFVYYSENSSVKSRKVLVEALRSIKQSILLADQPKIQIMALQNSSNNQYDSLTKQFTNSQYLSNGSQPLQSSQSLLKDVSKDIVPYIFFVLTSGERTKQQDSWFEQILLQFVNKYQPITAIFINFDDREKDFNQKKSLIEYQVANNSHGLYYSINTEKVYDSTQILSKIKGIYTLLSLNNRQQHFYTKPYDNYKANQMVVLTLTLPLYQEFHLKNGETLRIISGTVGKDIYVHRIYQRLNNETKHKVTRQQFINDFRNNSIQKIFTHPLRGSECQLEALRLLEGMYDITEVRQECRFIQNTSYSFPELISSTTIFENRKLQLQADCCSQDHDANSQKDHAIFVGTSLFAQEQSQNIQQEEGKDTTIIFSIMFGSFVSMSELILLYYSYKKFKYHKVQNQADKNISAKSSKVSPKINQTNSQSIDNINRLVY